jgi:hypothetical protein
MPQADTTHRKGKTQMNTATNKPRIRFESGIVAYIPLPGNKAITITPNLDFFNLPSFNIRSREWALYDYADFGLKAYDLLVEMVKVGK